MSAGTIALTNNSTTVGGTGTAFTTELKAGDFVGVIVGGAPYTLVVATIVSNTQLTIAVAYNGPTSTGLAWYAVPATLQVAITQKILNDMGVVARGMILEKNNWQKIFSSDPSVTVTRPDLSTFTGPSWGSLSDSLTGKAAKGANTDITSLAGLTTALSISQGGTGSKNASDARSALGTLSVTPASAGTGGSGDRIQHASGAGLFSVDYFNCYWYMQPADTNFWIAQAVSYAGTGGTASGYGRVIYAIKIADGTTKYVTVRTDKNTTVDANGFIKAASPIYRLISDNGLMPDDFTEGFTKSGSGAFNDEADGVSAEHIGTGKYLVRGCLGFAKEGWTVEVPQDENGNRLIFVTTKIETDGSISVSTYKRRFDVETAMIVAGEPVDIPEGRWIDLRLDMATGTEITS